MEEDERVEWEDTDRQVERDRRVQERDGRVKEIDTEHRQRRGAYTGGGEEPHFT